MTLFQNPIFLTQMRLVHRSGTLLALTMSTLVGGSLLAGLIYHFVQPKASAFSSAEEAGTIFYGWLLVLEMLLLVVGGFSRISRAVADERMTGLWDSNRLTPMRPSQLVAGYWFGAALRQVYMSAVLALLGLFIVLLAGLPVTLWLGTQALLFATAMLFGLLGLVVGMAFQRPQPAIGLLFLWTLVQLFSLFQPRFLLSNFLLPIYPTIRLFSSKAAWDAFPELFGIRLHPFPYSLGLQLVIGWFLWRAVVRKTANPFPPLLRCPEALALFGVLTAAQHGLIWGLWRGRFGVAQVSDDKSLLLAIVQGATLLVGAVLLILASPVPAQVRVEALQARFRSLRNVYSCSAATSALALTAVTTAALFTQCALSLASSGKAFCVATGNALTFFVVFALWLEFCRLRFQRRSIGLFALGLFLLCALPFVLAGLFSSPSWCRLSLLSPGIFALAHPAGPGLDSLLLLVAVHLAIAAALFILWRKRWQTLLKRGLS